MMYRNIVRCYYAVIICYLFFFFILCTECHFARMQTNFC